MLRVVIEFLSKSINLQRFEMESINISPILIAALGVALTDRQQQQGHLFHSLVPSRLRSLPKGIKFLSLRNIPLGDEGLRLLTPHLSKCRIQSLVLERCHLTDGSIPFLTSILKVRYLS
jgi:hypothetical protein